MGLPMSSSEIAVHVEGLGKTYTIYSRPLDRLRQLLARQGRRYGRDFVALGDVSFDLMRGEVLGVVGNNGAGKSTLLQLLCGTLRPTSGKLQVNGRIAALLELGAGFNPEFTGRENIFLNAAVLGLSNEEIEARFDSIVEFSGIGDFIGQPVKTYSSGMYVRLAFSIATSVEPDILIIDEALSVGDGAFARKSFDRIITLREAGTTILFCSHSMYQIEAICDRALWLEKGHVRMLDTPEMVTRAYAGDLLPAPVKSANLPKPAVAVDRPAQARLLDVKCAVDGKNAETLRLVSGVSSLRIDVRFGFDPALPLPSIVFGLETEAGVAVSSGSTVFDGVSVDPVAPGLGEVILEFPRVSLMRGRYRLTVFLACERAIHVYDQALYCAVLEMQHDGIEQGVCFLPHAWNNGPVVQVP